MSGAEMKLGGLGGLPEGIRINSDGVRSTGELISGWPITAHGSHLACCLFL